MSTLGAGPTIPEEAIQLTVLAGAVIHTITTSAYGGQSQQLRAVVPRMARYLALIVLDGEPPGDTRPGDTT